jgi:histidinol phosphatase-like enzyme
LKRKIKEIEEREMCLFFKRPKCPLTKHKNGVVARFTRETKIRVIMEIAENMIFCTLSSLEWRD